jgi:tetratricopeptide (TPR) repeat protein
MADIFVSYTESDRDWAFWIGHELEDLGHIPHIHEWEIPAGGDIMAWMVERHDKADHILCVVSKTYFEKPYSSLERVAAQWAAAGKRPGFALPVFVEAFEPPTLFAHLKRCELYGLREEEARARIKEFLTPAGKPAQRSAFPGGAKSAPATASAKATPKFPGSLANIPISVPLHFVGRDDTLAAIQTALAGTASRAAITALHGLRGVGKTTLAATYADRHRGEYRATWWIRAQTEPNMRADLVALGLRLGWVGADEKEEPALPVVLERLRDEGEGILLIFDNAPDADALRPYLPRGGRAQVLVTSNAPAWRGIASPVEIRVWPKGVGADYLIARTGREKVRPAAEALSEALGGLPLAHEQAAAYCERLDVSFDEYRKRFETEPARLLDDERDAPAEYHDRLTVAKTFALAIDEAAKLHPAAEPLIVHAALLAPEPIPLFLFSEAQEQFGEPLASTLAGDGLDEAVAALRTFALVDRETIVDERDPTITTDSIRLHRLVRQVAATRRTTQALEDAQRGLVEALAVVYPQGVFDDPQTWPRARRLDGLALALVGGDTVPPKGAEKPAAYLLDRLASYRQRALAAYAQARPMFERALAISKEGLGPEHPITTDSLNNLAGLLQDQGDLAAARPLFERTLAIREKAFGPEHPRTATSLNNLARLLQDQDDLAGARSLFERALAIREKALKPDDPLTAQSLNNLAFLLQAQGDLAGARPLYKRALVTREKTLGAEHPYTNTARGNLARVLLASGNANEALPLATTALAAHEKVLGQNHPWARGSAVITASVLNALGRTDEAAALRARYGIK